MSAKETQETHRFKTKDSWRTAINQAPKDIWIKSRNLGAGKSSSYIPIPIQQALADILFDEFDVFEEHYQQIENEVLCTVKISCLPSYPTPCGYWLRASSRYNTMFSIGITW